MASTTTPDRPVRLICVQPNPVFQEPKHLPIKPLTQAPIEIERPSDYLTSCIHRGTFKDIHPDLLKEYAKHYDIEIDHEKVLRAELMAVLCMKNEWIPVLPEQNATDDQGVSATATQTTPDSGDGGATIVDPDAEVESYIPDRFGTPEDTYDDAGPSTEADPNPKNSDGDNIDIDFNRLPSTLSLGDLTRLTSRLQDRHTRVQCALADATAATREAGANVLEMIARVEKEKARMKKIMGTVAEIVGEYDEKVELNEGSDEDVDEEVDRNLVSDEGKESAAEALRSSAPSLFGRGRNLPGLRPSRFCPNCRVARDLTVSQRHSVYLCAEHMPNPYQANETPNEDSSAAGSSATSNDKRKKLDLLSNEDPTIIFGFTMTTKPPQNVSSNASKGKKRSLEDSEGDEGSVSSNQSPKRARLGESNGINSQQASTSTKIAPLSRTTPVGGSSDPGVERQEENASPFSIFPGLAPSTTPQWGDPLTRRFTINDFEDPEEVAYVKIMEASDWRINPPSTSTTAPGNPNIPVAATPAIHTPSSQTLHLTDLDDAEEVENFMRQQRELRRRRHIQTSAVYKPNAAATAATAAIPRPSTVTPTTGSPLRRTLYVRDLNDLEDLAKADREQNLAASDAPPSGPTIPSGPAASSRQDSPPPTASGSSSRALSINRESREVGETTCSSPPTPGKRRRDSDDDEHEEGQKRIQKRGRLAEA